MKSFLRLVPSIIAGILSGSGLLFAPILLSYVIGIFPNSFVAALLLGLPGALIVGVIYLLFDRRPWIVVLAILGYEVAFVAVPTAVLFGLSGAIR